MRFQLGAITLPLVTLAFAACSSDPEPGSTANTEISCEVASLPLASNADGPTVERLTLLCETGGQLVPELVIVDPQGDADLQDVVQTLGVYAAKDCAGDVFEIEDDVSESGQPEWFGTVVDRADEPALYDTICASSSWPVELQVRDASGNEVNGVVEAVVVRS